MTDKISKAERAEIAIEFAQKHNGRFDPHLFLEEVERTGPGHPAFGWFRWDDVSAANEFRLLQARQFLHGLTIKTEVEIIDGGQLRFASVDAPLLVAPMNDRQFGGGYVLTAARGAQLDELDRQAVQAAQRLLDRFPAVLVRRPGAMQLVLQLVDALRAPALQLEHQPEMKQAKRPKRARAPAAEMLIEAG